jgi:hypothetical protein
VAVAVAVGLVVAMAVTVTRHVSDRVRQRRHEGLGCVLTQKTPGKLGNRKAGKEYPHVAFSSVALQYGPTPATLCKERSMREWLASA